MGRRAALVLGTAFSCLLNAELLPIRAYTNADGLASDHIDCIVADSRGFLWFCTREGLSRFDGYRFINLGFKEGLPHTVVSKMIETRSGEYLVGTARGLTRVNPTNQSARFTTYAPERDAAQNYVTALRQVQSGRIWCATRKGLFEWTGNGLRRRELGLSLVVQILDIAEDPRGDVWLATTAGIYVLGSNGVMRTPMQPNEFLGNAVYALFLDGKSRMWAATSRGLGVFKQRGDGAWSLAKAYTDKSGLAGTFATSMAESADGILWIGTNDGITRIALNDDEPKVLGNLRREQGLSDRQINALAVDQAGNIWAGTGGAGVMRIDRLGFTTYREQDGLATDRVWSVLEDRAGDLVVTTILGRGRKAVNILEGRRFLSVVPKPFEGHATWVPNRILLQSRTGEWWAATSQGLCRFGPLKAADLNHREATICYAPDTTIFQVFEDSKGGIWASAQSHQGVLGDQLIRWDPQRNDVFIFPARIAGGQTDDVVRAFAEDAHGNVWMGLSKGGLYRYNGSEFHYFQKSDGVPEGSIHMLLACESGLWIASNGGGLGWVRDTAEEHPHIEIYDAERGMASNIVETVVEDGEGRIYAGTEKGVDRLDPRTGHIRHYSSANGLAHGVFTSALRDHAGSIWFATTQGLSRLTPAPDHPPVKPRVFITDLRIGGASYALSQTGEERVSNLELQPSQNQLQVEFVGIDYEPGDVVRYSYRLEGADPSWSPPSTQHSINYAALEGGRYRFLVKAVTSEGVESAVPAEIDFTVLPPIWKRWWFQGLALALAMSLLFAGHRYRISQMMKLERMRTAIATDLHDDIGASLSQIAILSEVARVGGNGQERQTKSLERVATLARELVDAMGDIVWSIRAEPHGMDSLARRMREFALDLLGFQGIEFELRTPSKEEPAGLSLQVRRQLFLMFKECIHNAARHARCSAVTAELKVTGREIILTVQDNGAGMNPNRNTPESNGGTGILGMRTRAESLGGRMEFTSRHGEGCKVAIRLPLRRGMFAKAG